MLKHLFSALFLVISSVCFAHGWTLDNMVQVKRIREVAPSPDGKFLAYQVYEDITPVLYLKNLETDTTKQIAKNATDPKWSPGTETLAYLNTQNSQIVLYDPIQQSSHQLTDFTQHITSFQWSPNGKILAFLMQKPINHDQITTVEEEQRSNQVLCLISKDGDQFRQMTDGSFNVGACLLSNSFTFSPDGKYIVCPKTPNAETCAWCKAELVKVDLNSGNISPFVSGVALEPIYSPDGKWVAYIQATEEETPQDVWVVPAEGGTGRPLAQTFNRHILIEGGLLGWSKDSEHVYVLDYRKTKAELLALPLSGEEAQKIELNLPTIKHARLSENHKHIAYVAENSKQPPEIYSCALKDQKVTKCTALNGSLPLREVARTELIEYTSEDGLTIEGLLTYPLDYQGSKRFPLLLIVHGGPAYFFHETFIGSPHVYPLATFASQGYGVLRCNIRGSTGYGQTFRTANFADFGGKDFQDLTAGVDYLNKRGLIDPEKVGVMGWSFGGYLTAWAITQTDRFKAASVGAGYPNLLSMCGTTDISTFLPTYFGGEFWDKFDLFLERSALAHIQNAKTPTLIQHGKEDRRVPSSQALELYQALKRRGVPTKLMLFPRSEHIVQELELIQTGAKANLDWFNEYILGLGVR